MSNYRSEAARELNQERRTAEKERTLARHAGRNLKWRPATSKAGAWS